MSDSFLYPTPGGVAFHPLPLPSLPVGGAALCDDRGASAAPGCRPGKAAACAAEVAARRPLCAARPLPVPTPTPTPTAAKEEREKREKKRRKLTEKKRRNESETEGGPTRRRHSTGTGTSTSTRATPAASATTSTPPPDTLGSLATTSPAAPTQACPADRARDPDPVLARPPPERGRDPDSGRDPTGLRDGDPAVVPAE